ARFIDAFRQLFRLVMLGHARPIQIYFGIAPIVLRISASEDAALVNGRSARRTDLAAGHGGSPAGNGHPQSRDRDELGRDPGGGCRRRSQQWRICCDGVSMLLTVEETDGGAIQLTDVTRRCRAMTMF